MGIKFSNGSHIAITDNTKIERRELIKLFSESTTEEHKSLMRVLLCQIRDENPEAIKFKIDNNTMNSILFNLKTENLNFIIGNYGYLFLIELLKICEGFEFYEVCGKIKTAIEYHNEFTNNTAPTR